MKSLIFFVSIVLSFSISAAEVSKLNEKIEKLNQHSIELLGISINALHYLAKASPDHFLLVSELRDIGDLKYIKELESTNYVKTELHMGLPGGFQKNKEFIRIIPVGIGIETQRCLIALQHKKTLNQIK